MNQNTRRNQAEAALLITPRIVRNIARPAKAVSELHFGTENTIGTSPMTIGKVAPRSLAMSPSSSSTGVTPGSASPPVVPDPKDEPRAAQTAPAADDGFPVVTLTAPEQISQISAGQEFAVSVSIAGAEALPPAEVELNYDPGALEAIDEGEKSGVRMVKLSRGGEPVDLRFRIIAQKPVTTQITLGNLAFQGQSGGLSAPVVLPPAANIEIH